MKVEKIINYGNLMIYLAVEDGALVEVRSLSVEEGTAAGLVLDGEGKYEILDEKDETTIEEHSKANCTGGREEKNINNCEPEKKECNSTFMEVNNSKSTEAKIMKEAERQLKEYFDGDRHDFDLPLKAKGTEFQKEVWRAISEIPYGETRTYGEIAKAIGRPKGARACGQAANKNPLQFVIPCHRVIGVGGRLVGYAGGVRLKTSLLKMENNGFRIHKNNT